MIFTKASLPSYESSKTDVEVPDKHFDPSQNLTGERYLQKCFEPTRVKVQRVLLHLKTDEKTYAWLYFWLEVNCLDNSTVAPTL